MTRSRSRHFVWPRLRVGGKFAFAVSVLMLAVIAVAVIAVVSLADTNKRANRLFDDHLTTTQQTADLSNALDDVDKAALLRAQTQQATAQAVLDAALDTALIPRAQQILNEVADLDRDAPQELAVLTQIRTELGRYLQLRKATLAPAAGAVKAGQLSVAERVSAIFDPATRLANTLRTDESQLAAASKRANDRSYWVSQLLLTVGVTISLLLGLCVALALTRNMVPRIRRYAQFATDIANGKPTAPLDRAGQDELTDLAVALNLMVAQRHSLSGQEERQTEFVDSLQVTSTEEEAHELIQRHLERSLPRSQAVVLQRNNSANRLQAATTLLPDSEIGRRLIGADPRSCLALRFARTHLEGPELTPLLSCGVCGGRDIPSSCEPLLVGGEVIGSVLVSHEGEFDNAEHVRIKTSVAQAAPVLANLRNLALAEFRANNDSLTGLPNKRATDDTLKRLVAQASRSVLPLTAIMLDLDHFKQINDRYGHGKGDEVLAAVGAALTSCLRESDFAGRFGGEEFLVLLPDTGLEGAKLVAEKIRSNVAAITVPGLDRDVTVSLGVADLLEHAGNAQGLLREAARALYAAKASGRNRTVVAPPGGEHSEQNADPPSSETARQTTV